MFSLPTTEKLQEKSNIRVDKIAKLKSSATVLTSVQQSFITQIAEDKLPEEFKSMLGSLSNAEAKSSLETEIKKIGELTKIYESTITAHQAESKNPEATTHSLRVSNDKMNQAYEACGTAMLTLRARYQGLPKFDKLKPKLDILTNSLKEVVSQPNSNEILSDILKNEQALYDELSSLIQKCIAFNANFKKEFLKLSDEISKRLRPMQENAFAEGKVLSGSIVAVSTAKAAASTAKVAASTAKAAASTAKVAASTAKVAASMAEAKESEEKEAKTAAEIAILKARYNANVQLVMQKMNEYTEANQVLAEELRKEELRRVAETFNAAVPESLNPYRTQLSPSAPLPLQQPSGPDLPVQSLGRSRVLG